MSAVLLRKSGGEPFPLGLAPVFLRPARGGGLVACEAEEARVAARLEGQEAVLEILGRAGAVRSRRRLRPGEGLKVAGEGLVYVRPASPAPRPAPEHELTLLVSPPPSAPSNSGPEITALVAPPGEGRTDGRRPAERAAATAMIDRESVLGRQRRSEKLLVGLAAGMGLLCLALWWAFQRPEWTETREARAGRNELVEIARRRVGRLVGAPASLDPAACRARLVHEERERLWLLLEPAAAGTSRILVEGAAGRLVIVVRVLPRSPVEPVKDAEGTARKARELVAAGDGLLGREREGARHLLAAWRSYDEAVGLFSRTPFGSYRPGWREALEGRRRADGRLAAEWQRLRAELDAAAGGKGTGAGAERVAKLVGELESLRRADDDPRWLAERPRLAELALEAAGGGAQ